MHEDAYGLNNVLFSSHICYGNFQYGLGWDLGLAGEDLRMSNLRGPSSRLQLPPLLDKGWVYCPKPMASSQRECRRDKDNFCISTLGDLLLCSDKL